MLGNVVGQGRGGSDGSGWFLLYCALGAQLKRLKTEEGMGSMGSCGRFLEDSSLMSGSWGWLLPDPSAVNGVTYKWPLHEASASAPHGGWPCRSPAFQWVTWENEVEAGKSSTLSFRSHATFYGLPAMPLKWPRFKVRWLKWHLTMGRIQNMWRCV